MQSAFRQYNQNKSAGFQTTWRFHERNAKVENQSRLCFNPLRTDLDYDLTFENRS